MTIEVKERRESATSISTGAPAAPPADSDHVLVKPLTTYLEGQEHKGPHSEPYRVPRHHANELKGHGIAKIIEEPKPPVPSIPDTDPDLEPEDETEVEQPDDTSRAPDQNQTTASTVPALPGAEGQRPGPGPVPPAAVSDAPQPARRGRGRPPARRD